MHYLLVYDLNKDYGSRRLPLRAAHLAYAQKFVDRGELVLGGALAKPMDKAILLFRADSPSVPESFARQDPYGNQGLVRRWEVREWTTVVGPEAAVPINPGTI
jgi:uncharacterized protein